MKHLPHTVIIIVLLMTAVMANAKSYQVTVAKLNVRKAPNTSGQVLGSLTQNATVEVNRISGGWAEISYKGQKAYISAQYITPAKSTTAKSNTSSKSSTAKSNTSSKSSTAKATTAKSTATSTGIGKSYVEGFHMTFGAYFTGRSFIGSSGIIKKGAIGYNRYGISFGPGFEYSGAVVRGKNANLLLGFRSGLYYDWHGTANFPDEGTDADHTQFGRVSTHSLTVPIQPMLSVEWKTGKSDMALGLFTGPIFEFNIAHNVLSWGIWDGNEYIQVMDYISGKEWYMKGPYETTWWSDASCCEVFNCYWGTGVYFQANRFRVQLASDWGIHRYVWTKGGLDDDETMVATERLFVNRFINLGFSITLF